MESEGPGFDRLPQKVFRDFDLAMLLNLAYAEGRKSIEDALLGGTGFIHDGKRVPPENVYLSPTEMEIKKAMKDFDELLEWANDMAHGGRMTHNIEDLAERFYAWKKARGIE